MTDPVYDVRRPKLVILMPMVWSIRNMVHSGVLDQLIDFVDLHLFINQYHEDIIKSEVGETFSRAASCQSLLPPPLKHRVKGLPFLLEVIGNAFSRRNKIGSYKIYQRWFRRNQSKSMLFRYKLIDLFGLLSQPSIIFFNLYRLYNFLYQIQFDLDPIKKQLRDIHPDGLLSTVNVEDQYERAYILAAKELGIPVINSIVSFDNLTSKPAHLVYDYYLVWNIGMRDQLLRFYPQVKPGQVCITGTPQFDFHRRPECLWDREYTMMRLGLPSTAKYILYGASPKSLTPEEPELVSQLAEKLQSHNILKDYWIVVRTHPRDDWMRWEKVKRKSDRIIISTAWNSMPDARGWTIPTMDDHARLTSSLAHAAVCINIASTITFDAAILDCPVIGICFAHEPNAPHDILYEEYATDHYEPLVESGGLCLAYNWKDLISIIFESVENPARNHAARTSMVAQECGIVDGKAGQRVTQAILNYFGKNK